MKTLYVTIIATSVFFGSCSKKGLDFKAYDFQMKLAHWDDRPYNLTSFVVDTTLVARGAQYAAVDYSCIGNIEEALKVWDSQKKSPITYTKDDSLKFSQYQPRPAIPIIFDKAKDHQVTIINEAHHSPQHRVFTRSLLKGLFEQGYRHLGIETLDYSLEKDSLIHALKYPNLLSGYYTKEPQYGLLVREALQIGYRVFGYESSDFIDPKSREVGQAENIQKYMKQNPIGKYLVHCGYDHVMEGEIGGKWEKAMAARLNEYTGIDPLSINQTRFSEQSNRSFENVFYQITDVNEPSIFINDAGINFNDYKKSSYTDICIFHPRTKFINRPQWLIHENRREYSLDLRKVEIKPPFLVLAYIDGEETGSAIPYDVQESLNGKVNLVLDQGIYNIVIWNTKDKALISQFNTLSKN